MQKNEVQQALVVFFAQHHKNGRLVKGAIEEAKKNFPFKDTQIKLIWRKARAGAVDPDVQVDYTTQKVGNSGRKAKYDKQKVLNIIQRLTVSQHRNLRALSCAMSISRSALGRMRKAGWFVWHSNAIKPFLTEENKMARLEFAKSFVNP